MTAAVVAEGLPVVLYVDDDFANRQVFGIAFQGRFPMVVCESGAQALEVFERNVDVAVVFTDQRMPRMSGTELLRQVKERSPDTVGVMVTAHDDVPPILEVLNRQLAERYIIKPWRPGEIETTVVWGYEVYRLNRARSEMQMKLLRDQRFTTLGSIAAGVLHDMKQPLAVVRSNLEHVQRSVARLATLATADSDVVGAIEDAMIATQQLNDLAVSAQRFLNTGKSQSMASGDVALAARYSVTLCRPAIAIQKGVLKHLVDERLPLVTLGTTELTQVIVNLLVNAAQALVPGRRPSTVELHVSKQGERVALTVRDTGRGMSPATLARVREPFFTTKGEGEGTGIGLYNVERIVTEAGGTLAIDSVENEGTTVTIVLPPAASATSSARP